MLATKGGQAGQLMVPAAAVYLYMALLLRNPEVLTREPRSLTKRDYISVPVVLLHLRHGSSPL